MNTVKYKGKYQKEAYLTFEQYFRIVLLVIASCTAAALLAVAATAMLLQYNGLRKDNERSLIQAERRVQEVIELSASSSEDASVVEIVDNLARKVEELQEEKTRYEAEQRVMQFTIDKMLLESNNIIFDTNDIRIKANATEEQLNALLEGSPLEGLGWEILKAEKEYEVNAIALISIMKHESVLGRYVGNNHNLGGLTRYDGGWMGFNSYEHCIDYMGWLLGTQYLSKEGRYYNGVSLTAVNKFYCGDDIWVKAVTSHARASVRKASAYTKGR